MRSVLVAATLSLSVLPALAGEGFPICGGGKRVNCVVDGDTFWVAGTKVRIAGIDAPEVSSPHCRAERALGDEATLRLAALLSAGAFELLAGPQDEDRYGRKLRTVMRGGVSIGEQLVDEGLARRWDGARRSRCN